MKDKLHVQGILILEEDIASVNVMVTKRGWAFEEWWRTLGRLFVSVRPGQSASGKTYSGIFDTKSKGKII